MKTIEEMKGLIRQLDELEIELEIDEGNLEVVQQMQSQLYYEASKGYALAFAEADQAKQTLEQIEANLAKDFRQVSTEKITDSSIKEYVKSHDRYVNQYRFLTQKKFEENVWKGLMRAFDQRGDRLRDLVTLTSIGYWNSGLLTSQDTAKERLAEARRAKNKEIDPEGA